MSDPYATIAEKDEALQSKLAQVLELRAADRRQQEMLSTYLNSLDLNPASKVLEIGCGTGAISRELLELENVASVTGIDPSPVFIQYATQLSEGKKNISFHTGDARVLQFDDESFDLVLFYTTLCHVPAAEKALQEARRVLRPGGVLAIFDGDYTTVSVATSAYDPLQRVIDMTVANFVENVWLSRQLPRLLGQYGFNVEDFRSHGYTRQSEPDYFLTLIDRGIDLLVNNGAMGQAQCESLRDEALRRVQANEFFGHISYISTIARKSN